MTEIKRFSNKIFIDADACPVKTEIIDSASRNRIEVFVVSNGGIRPSSNPIVITVYVESGIDAADNWITENIKEDDIVVTADIPLSALCIKKGAYVISFHGKILNENNIGIKIASRNLMSELRSANPFFQAKGEKFSKADRICFKNSFDKILQTIKKSL